LEEVEEDDDDEDKDESRVLSWRSRFIGLQSGSDGNWIVSFKPSEYPPNRGEEDLKGEVAGCSGRHRHDPEHPGRVRLLRRTMQEYFQLYCTLLVMVSFPGLSSGYRCLVLHSCPVPDYGLGCEQVHEEVAQPARSAQQRTAGLHLQGAGRRGEGDSPRVEADVRGSDGQRQEKEKKAELMPNCDFFQIKSFGSASLFMAIYQSRL
ncbi:hypothetical protein CEXT_578211, partial [Caerostris extrusa]